MAIDKDDSGRAICTVSYILDSRIEKFVDQSRITVTIMPYKDSTSANRQSGISSKFRLRYYLIGSTKHQKGPTLNGWNLGSSPELTRRKGG
jgi:hypothetical protein